MSVSKKRYNEMRNAIDEMEGALFGCESIEWEEIEELYSKCTPTLGVRLYMTASELLRVKKALDELNRIVNDPEYNRVK